MKCDNGCRIGYGCEVHDNTDDYWHKQFFVERTRAERAETEVEQWKKRYHESQDNWTLIDMGNRALADRLAEALQLIVEHGRYDEYMAGDIEDALVAWEGGRG